MATTQRFVGASTPFGTITAITGNVYNPQVTVRSKDGSVSIYQLPFLIALGVTLQERMTA